MKQPTSSLDRLLAAAAQVPSSEIVVPFGFETRVVALWRSTRDSSWQFARTMRRIAASAAAVALCASAAAYWQFQVNDELASPLTNNYAIADDAIAVGALQ